MVYDHPDKILRELNTIIEVLGMNEDLDSIQMLKAIEHLEKAKKNINRALLKGTEE